MQRLKAPKFEPHNMGWCWGQRLCVSVGNAQCDDVHDAIDDEKLKSLFMNMYIEKRHYSKSANLFSNLSIEEKMKAFKNDGTALAVSITDQALKVANTKAEDIGKIVFVTSTDLCSPGLDIVLIDKLGLQRNVTRTSVNFTGCVGGLGGLTILNDYCISHPGNTNFKYHMQFTFPIYLSISTSTSVCLSIYLCPPWV